MSQNQKPQENQAAEAIATASSWIETNKKQIIGIVAAIVVVVGGYLAYTYLYQQPREEKAQTLFTDGLEYVAKGDSLSLTQAINGDGEFIGYAKIAKEYSGTKGANLANVQVGTCYAKLGKYAEAIPYLEDFTPGDDQSVSPQAIFALAQCYAGVNDLDKAIATFKEAAELADNVALSPMYLLEAGKLLEKQEKKADALKIYETIQNDYPQSSLSAGSPAEIEKYIERAKK
jgi:tetratricopeptide (TPR) repeat protein